MNKTSKTKVAIAMSGGVDSSVAAALLKNQGYDCVGIFLKFWKEPKASAGFQNKCCSAEAYEDARRVAGKLQIPIYTLNFEKDFKKDVVDYFLKSHRKGLTPNPCVQCNKFVKLGLLLRKLKQFDCEFLATGHYVKLTSEQACKPGKFLNFPGKRASSRISLQRAKDKSKDQSYFLYTLTQSQLKHLLFPLGDYTKEQVRGLAKKFKLPVYQKSESQEICFIPEKTHYPFLQRNLKLKPGPIITVAGETVGRHDGLPLYTLGQRKGIKIGGIGPFYAVKLDYSKNTLVVSKNKNDIMLYARKFRLKNINWINSMPKNDYGIMIRYQSKIIPCKISNAIVILKKPTRAVMPGQSAVIYQGQNMLGGGVIDKMIN